MCDLGVGVNRREASEMDHLAIEINGYHQAVDQLQDT